MLYPEFKKYLEENADGYKMFIEKALENEKAKNKKDNQLNVGMMQN